MVYRLRRSTICTDERKIKKRCLENDWQKDSVHMFETTMEHQSKPHTGYKESNIRQIIENKSPTRSNSEHRILQTNRGDTEGKLHDRHIRFKDDAPNTEICNKIQRRDSSGLRRPNNTMEERDNLGPSSMDNHPNNHKKDYSRVGEGNPLLNSTTDTEMGSENMVLDSPQNSDIVNTIQQQSYNIDEQQATTSTVQMGDDPILLCIFNFSRYSYPIYVVVHLMFNSR